MPKKIARLAVGDADGLRSSEWSIIWNTTTSDIYVMSRIMGGTFKASLHQSGRCHIKAPPAKWRGNGKSPDLVQDWQIDNAAALVFPFSIIIPTSELRQAVWSRPHTETSWLRPGSIATEFGVFLSTFTLTDEQLRTGGWNNIIMNDTLPDRRQISIVTGNPTIPDAKRNELIALKAKIPIDLDNLANPRLVIVAGDGNATRHFVEAALR